MNKNRIRAVLVEFARDGFTGMTPKFYVLFVVTVVLLIAAVVTEKYGFGLVATLTGYLAGTCSNEEIICDSCYESLESDEKPTDETGVKPSYLYDENGELRNR